MTTATASREELTETAIRALVGYEKKQRAGSVLLADLISLVTPHLDAATDAGCSRTVIHTEADLRYGQWLIDNARREQTNTTITVRQFIEQHRELIAGITGNPIPEQTSPDDFVAHLQEAAANRAGRHYWGTELEYLEEAHSSFAEAAKLPDPDHASHLAYADRCLRAIDPKEWS